MMQISATKKLLPESELKPYSKKNNISQRKIVEAKRIVRNIFLKLSLKLSEQTYHSGINQYTGCRKNKNGKSEKRKK